LGLFKFIYKVISNYQELGQVRNPFTQRMGQPSTLTDGDLTYLKAILEANPGLYLDEMQEKLTAVRDVPVSIATAPWNTSNCQNVECIATSRSK
jgi:transposase